MRASFRIRIALLSLAGAAALFLTFFGCESEQKSRPMNIILISVDTLRADHLGCYGYERDVSPTIDKLAAQGVTFEEAIVPIPKTTPSLISMLSSLYPKTHGVLLLGVAASEEIEMLPETLKTLGYQTSGIVGQYCCSSKFGLGQGFDYYDDEFTTKTLFANMRGKFLPSFERRALNVVHRTRQWLGAVDKEKPFFLWLHFMDPHGAYDPPGKFAEKYSGPTKWSERCFLGTDIPRNLIPHQVFDNGITDFDYYLNRYDGEINYLDTSLKKLFDMLKRNDLYEDSLIIFTADHGEYMGEADAKTWYFSHGLTSHETEVRVPLIFKLPGNELAGKRVEKHVSLLDIAPTITDMLDATPEFYEGRSLLGLMRSDDENGFDDTNYVIATEGNVIAIRKGNMKLVAEVPEIKEIYTRPRGEEKVSQWNLRLIDLESDPLERGNLIEEQGELAGQLLLELVRWVKSPGSLSHLKLRGEERLDEETERALRSLGYIQ